MEQYTLTKWMLEFSWRMWNERKLALHGTNIKESQEKRLEELRKDVEYLYRQVQTLPQPHDADINHMFKLKEDKRKCKGVVALETWIKIITKIVEEVEAHNAQN